MNNVRLQKLEKLLNQSGLDGIALNPGPTLTYLTGLTFHLSERPTLLLWLPPADPFLIVPELEMVKVGQSLIPLQPVPFGDTPTTWPQVFKQAVQLAHLRGEKIGVEPTRLRYLEMNLLQSAEETIHFVGAETALAGLRMAKDSDEIAAMRKAVKIAQQALTFALPHFKTGVSEQDAASELSLQLLRAGSASELPFPPIVSSGPNSANPHAFPSERKFSPGDMLVVDWGAAYNGYFSDLTRTFAIEKIDPEFETVHNIVQQANAAGRAVGKPGLRAGAVDDAARQVIQAAGYGVYFTHRTGHGLGMEGHEPPYMFAENDLVLTPGMTYTVEPGIYIAGRNGVRIEDDVVITAEGCESLSDMPRDLTIIG